MPKMTSIFFLLDIELSISWQCACLGPPRRHLYDPHIASSPCLNSPNSVSDSAPRKHPFTNKQQLKDKCRAFIFSLNWISGRGQIFGVKKNWAFGREWRRQRRLHLRAPSPSSPFWQMIYLARLIGSWTSGYALEKGTSLTADLCCIQCQVNHMTLDAPNIGCQNCSFFLPLFRPCVNSFVVQNQAE